MGLEQFPLNELCNPQLKSSTSGDRGVPFGARTRFSIQRAPNCVSSAPPSAPHGECCTRAFVAKALATHGVYPTDTESPTMSTFFSEVLYGIGGPVLQTWSPIVTLPMDAEPAPSLPITWGNCGIISDAVSSNCCWCCALSALGMQTLTTPKPPIPYVP